MASYDVALAQWAERTKDQLVSELREAAPKRSGDFAASIEGGVHAGGAEIEITGDAVPGVFLMRGTRAFTLPKKQGVYANVAAGEIFGPGPIDIPAHAPDEFVDRVIGESMDAVTARLLDGYVAAWSQGI